MHGIRLEEAAKRPDPEGLLALPGACTDPPGHVCIRGFQKGPDARCLPGGCIGFAWVSELPAGRSQGLLHREAELFPGPLQLPI